MLNALQEITLFPGIPLTSNPDTRPRAVHGKEVILFS
ncbi:hypothetical protein BN997_03832 [Oceanobacillus oncorhynchi]|uniref:Uncharacterized protein n=1 Tax=Oceanobacillus oncorhynchi TaxID=545501 RepID=A0A0A1MYS0_9BACI|nr:hypothetical protein BN997_03832 [Oceanobacillus oncorhynchi]